MARTLQTLDIRHDSDGGGIKYDPLIPPIDLPAVIILIHGYNNTFDDAAQAYTDFLKNEDGGLRLPAAEVIGFYWPGDKDWGFARPAAYPFEIKTAKESAEVLGECLADMIRSSGRELEITLICHSLGNRVVLELLWFLLANYNPIPNIKAACLMAAAVPVSFVDATGPLNSAASAIQRSLVLFSGGDGVLGWAFPIGELAAGEGSSPAVGLGGQPWELWRNPPSDRRERQMYNYKNEEFYGHSDYWPGPESFKAIAEFLNPALPQTPLQNSIAKSPGAEPRSTPQHQLNYRQLTTRTL